MGETARNDTTSEREDTTVDFLTSPTVLADALAIVHAAGCQQFPVPDMYPCEEKSVCLSWAGTGWTTTVVLATDGTVEVVATSEGEPPSEIIEYPSVRLLVEDIIVLGPLIMHD